MERCGSRVQPKSHIHTPGNVGECEGVSPHTPKWTPTLWIGVMMDSQIFRKWFEGSKVDTSYGQKKGQESKCQFDSWPIKVKKHPELHMCGRLATYCWKALDKGYNFFLQLTSIKGLHKTLCVSKWRKFEFWKLHEKHHLGVTSIANHIEYYKGEGGGFPQVWVVMSLVSPCILVVH
jgi:hypothetical protein